MPWCPNSKSETIGKWVFLIGCTDDQEASMIESFLTSENILVLRKYGGASEYLKITCGMTKLGVDLYVKENELEIAKEILGEVGARNIADSNRDENSIKSSQGTAWNKGKKRLFLISIISLIFILGSVIVSIFSTITDIVS
ncbi:hypothetical protein DSOL_3895 [Desulfosporosinus metallidurans]|uniref:Uncharacterized protein n=1 Tax=Desulfosporosinus metallidurans TaxID=1888891 RepID=A0A1Q8QNE3_9FIRM|nr:hypothetical protein DSOL_3895 [Desulfosporosinus metallidurans]